MNTLEKAVIIMLLILSTVYAQNKLSVGIALSWEKSFTPQAEQPVVANAKNYGGGGEMLAYIQYEPNDRFFLRTGLGIGESKQRTKVKGISFPDAIDTVSGLRYVLDMKTKTTTGWLTIPIDIGYRFPVKSDKWSLYSGLGASIQIAVTASAGTSITSFGGASMRNGFDKRFLFDFPEDEVLSGASFRLFTGVEKKMGKRLVFAFEPYLRYDPSRSMVDFLKGREAGVFDAGFALRLRRQ
jgi:hypothetical protein